MIKNYRDGSKESKKDLITGLNEIHNELLHPVISKFKHTLSRYLNIKGLSKIIQKICFECKICNQEKDLFHNFGVTTYEFNVISPREMIGADIKEPIQASRFRIALKHGKFYIIVMVDIFSEYTCVDFIMDINSSTISGKLENSWLRKFGLPMKLISDNGRQFIASDFKTLMDKYNIKYLTCTPYNPTGNGIVEKINKVIGIALRISRGSTLKELKNNILRRVNCTSNSNLRYSPIEIFHNIPIFRNSDKIIKVNCNEVKEELKSKCEQYNKLMRMKRRKFEIYEGDKVYVKANSQEKVEKNEMAHIQ